MMFFYFANPKSSEEISLLVVPLVGISDYILLDKITVAGQLIWTLEMMKKN